MAYGKVRIDNMSGTNNGKDLVTVRYQVGSADKEIENGNVVAVGKLMDGEREIRLATTPKANTPLSEVVLIATPEVDKTKKYTVLEDFINHAGTNCRGYRLNTGDIFSVSTACLTGSPAVDAVVELQAGTKLNVVSSLTASSTEVGKVIAIEGDWIVIEVA